MAHVGAARVKRRQGPNSCCTGPHKSISIHVVRDDDLSGGLAFATFDYPARLQDLGQELTARSDTETKLMRSCDVRTGDCSGRYSGGCPSTGPCWVKPKSTFRYCAKPFNVVAGEATILFPM